jgi:hypothetical protein
LPQPDLLRGVIAVLMPPPQSLFVGVTWHKQNTKWMARIKVPGEKDAKYLGCFADERDAARAFDTAARRARGKDAHGGRSGTNRLNFPTDDERP